MAGARLGGANPRGDMLAIELDSARRADGLPLLSALAGIHPDCGCSGPGANWKLALVALQKTFRVVVCRFCDGVVALRAD